MLVDEKHALLYLHPKLPCAKTPVVDDVTLTMFRAFTQHVQAQGTLYGPNHAFQAGLFTLGVHWCTGCPKTWRRRGKYEGGVPGSQVLDVDRNGPRSTGRDYQLTGGLVTNALCVHYVACHREEVPAAAIAKIETTLNTDVTSELSASEQAQLHAMIVGRPDQAGFPHPA